MKALVLAAGLGSRLRARSGTLPKPLMEIRGTPVIRHTLRWLARSGVERVWINLHHRPDEVRTAVGDGADLGLIVHYSFEQSLLGTAGAVRRLETEWTAPFLVVYGDNLVSFDLGAFITFHHDHGGPVSLAVFDPATHPHTGMAGGRVVVDDTRVVAFREGASAGAHGLVNAGVYLLSPEVVPGIPAGEAVDFGRDVFPKLLDEGIRLHAYAIDGYCLGIDTPDAYARADELVRQGVIALS